LAEQISLAVSWAERCQSDGTVSPQGRICPLFW